ncbi:MAG TPA: molybdopterin oxidoreductase [Hydrogenophaga sp.]|jgi:molybdopterin-containing oxidoreductase family membrane subunit|uniref:NrfD/PsrC family molybdoenzyme membrane anchor subunit n=1 Tax=Hydrogenophaga TaxID=47420 RepID=UPI0008CA6E83|nr:MULTISPECIES: NrfD/PsrC family molybdoenzyme membrane anchor subunit [Hydrogenophaga]MBU4181039.1 polysulfide reductase NrfD [Gammaproteobacteria bacterium]OGA75557.1 MAG: molybdopterin oxidoreductase [Burkholderiales bacterium GWE1_65_30]OGA93683.1 MAG: molybdopterin oxidoreductase [Burkholderiales bacterium GWF1_66_17]MBU4282038.1 polysulfide reductase NrfD [Gammaproteobacteria bacterium]MBU4323512.1 polysulfide reductase NrfD [Gammaproteobacteria bacterium]
MRTREDIRNFWLVAVLAGAITAVGLGAAHYMELHGHIVTGMNNQVVWGLPHVFAIFMIVAASGVLNVASIGSVFGQTVYKPRAPLSGLLCIALLMGGLMVLMLDLGRPDRVIVAATHYNFKSVFAWNVFLYSGMTAIVAVYLWTMFERRMNKYSKPAGLAALVWRFVLTTGTGSIFAFLVARQAYQSALLAPLFIVLSFGWGLAVFLVTQSTMYAWEGRVLDGAIRRRMARLLGVFIAASMYLVAVYHLTNLYYAKQAAFERFLLVDGGLYPLLFWGGYVLVGSVLPLLLLFHPKLSSARYTFAASALVVVGAFAFLYVFIIGGQAFPLEIFPGHTVSSSFGDGAIASYAPSLPEFLLGVGGLGAALLLTVVGVRAFDFMPQDDFVSAKS